MAKTCCFCISLRAGTIIITALIFIGFLFSAVGMSTLMSTVKTFYTISSENGKEIKIKTEIDLSPYGMDYIFAVFLLVVTLAMLLSAILRKSEILFYALITYLILWVSLIVYSSVGEEKGGWTDYKFPPTVVIKSKTGELYAAPKSVSSIGAVFGYVINGYFMFVVYSYVQQLRQGTPTSGQVISA